MRRVWPVSHAWRKCVLAVLTVAAILFPVVALSQYRINNYRINNADCISNRQCTSPNCFVEIDGGQRIYFCCLAGKGTFTTCRAGSASSCQQRSRTQMVDCQQCYRGTRPCGPRCPGGRARITEIHSCY